MEPGPAQVHLMPLCHLPDRNESLHNWNQGGLRCQVSHVDQNNQSMSGKQCTAHTSSAEFDMGDICA